MLLGKYNVWYPLNKCAVEGKAYRTFPLLSCLSYKTYLQGTLYRCVFSSPSQRLQLCVCLQVIVYWVLRFGSVAESFRWAVFSELPGVFQISGESSFRRWSTTFSWKRVFKCIIIVLRSISSLSSLSSRVIQFCEGEHHGVRDKCFMVRLLLRVCVV